MRESEKIINLKKESDQAIKRGMLYIGFSVIMSVLAYYLTILEPEENIGFLWFAIGFVFVSAFLYLYIGYYFQIQYKKGYIYKIRTVRYLKEGEL
jgi:hypothetical protein